MKKWTHKHTLLTVAIVGVAGYLLYKQYQKSTGKVTPPASGGDKSSFTGGTPYFNNDGVNGMANPYKTKMTNQQYYSGAQ